MCVSCSDAHTTTAVGQKEKARKEGRKKREGKRGKIRCLAGGGVSTRQIRDMTNHHTVYEIFFSSWLIYHLQKVRGGLSDRVDRLDALIYHLELLGEFKVKYKKCFQNVIFENIFLVHSRRSHETS